MSHFLDRLKFLGKAHETFAGGHGAVTLEPQESGRFHFEFVLAWL